MSLFGGLFEGNKEAGLFLGGLLMGTAGLRILTSSDAKKVYVQGTAAALRGKEEVMTAATALRENCEDIYAEAVEVNEKRAAKKAEEAEEAIIEDTADAAAEEA